MSRQEQRQRVVQLTDSLRYQVPTTAAVASKLKRGKEKEEEG